MVLKYEPPAESIEKFATQTSSPNLHKASTGEQESYSIKLCPIQTVILLASEVVKRMFTSAYSLFALSTAMQMFIVT